MKTLDKTFAIQVNDVDETDGIDNDLNDLAEQINVYPNPSGSSIFLSLPENIKHYSFELIDINGKILLKDKSISDAEIELRPFPSGIYYLRIMYADEISIIKILKE